MVTVPDNKEINLINKYIKTVDSSDNVDKCLNLDTKRWGKKTTLEKKIGSIDDDYKIYSSEESRLEDFVMWVKYKNIWTKLSEKNLDTLKYYNIDRKKYYTEKACIKKGYSMRFFPRCMPENAILVCSGDRGNLLLFKGVNGLVYTDETDSDETESSDGSDNDAGIVETTKSSKPTKPTKTSKAIKTKTIATSTSRTSKQAIPPSLKQNVWTKSFDTSIGSCFCCKKKLEQSVKWHCGHILSESNGGTLTISNMHPVCRNCNLKMAKTHMYLWMITEGYGDNIPLDTPASSLYSALYKIRKEASINLNHLISIGKITVKIQKSYEAELDNSKSIDRMLYLSGEIESL